MQVSVENEYFFAMAFGLEFCVSQTFYLDGAARLTSYSPPPTSATETSA